MTATGPAPLVALVADRKSVTSGPWVDVPNDTIPHSFNAALEAAGAATLMIPALEIHLGTIERVLEAVDGVLLPGGRDIDAALYGATAHDENDAPLRVRDDLETALVRGAVERGMPVLGLCRGMQVINVALGGSLEQHLADRLEMTPHRDRVGDFTEHRVHLDPGSRLDGIIGASGFGIASHHHQAVDRLGEGLVPSAWADDGVVEAVELRSPAFCLGVQWHPEQRSSAESERIFASFAEAARVYRTAGQGLTRSRA